MNIIDDLTKYITIKCRYGIYPLDEIAKRDGKISHSVYRWLSEDYLLFKNSEWYFSYDDTMTYGTFGHVVGNGLCCAYLTFNRNNNICCIDKYIRRSAILNFNATDIEEELDKRNLNIIWYYAMSSRIMSSRIMSSRIWIQEIGIRYNKDNKMYIDNIGI